MPAASTSALKSIIKRRESLQDTLVADVTGDLEALAENIARRLAAMLGGTPDSVFKPDGNDGVRVGATTVERSIAALSDSDAIRAYMAAASLDELLELVEASGLDIPRGRMREAVGAMTTASARAIEALGVDVAGVLNSEGVTTAVGDFLDRVIDEDLFRMMGLSTATRIRQTLLWIPSMQDADALARAFGDAELASVNGGARQAQIATHVAMADRTTQEAVRREIDPDGEDFLIAYMGPLDGLTRPFCRHMLGDGREAAGLAFKPTVFARADNAQGLPPIVAAGGYRCRHNITPVVDDDEFLAALGLGRGAESDVAAANESARSSRKGKGRKR